jgi:hypothetical protein
MPRIFRAMTAAEDHLPTVVQSARGLGVRVPEDVNLNEKGQVDDTCGGMSVAPTWQDLPPHRIPKRLNDKLSRIEKDARGSNADFCWRMGSGDFVKSIVSERLVLVIDDVPEGDDPHGLVAPMTSCEIEAFRNAIADTRDEWVVDEDSL